MVMVQRYDEGDWCDGEYPECQMNPVEDGGYVKYEAYEQLQSEIKKLEGIVREINNLCENCRSIDDAIYIAGGRKDTSTESGCEKCWVDRLQAKNDKLNKKIQGMYEDMARKSI